MGVEWFGVVMGLGLYYPSVTGAQTFWWFQRAMAAGSMNDAQRTPLIGALPKMLIPFLVIVPGLIALAYTTVFS
jgi:SSS family solute:Na+ symporter